MTLRGPVLGAGVELNGRMKRGGGMRAPPKKVANQSTFKKMGTTTKATAPNGKTKVDRAATTGVS